MWTSPIALEIMGIIAYFITESGNLTHKVLALREVDCAYSGENMAKILFSVVAEYGIASKIGYLMMDNAENNSTLTKHFSDRKYMSSTNL